MLADVIVDVTVLRLDRRFSYSVPERLRERVQVGSIVRVPLRNRRVRGWVAGVDESADGEGLEELASLSGRRPVFDSGMLDVAVRLSRRYVQPTAHFLRLMTPPRLGRPGSDYPERRPAGRRTPRERHLEVWRPAPGEDPADRYEELIAGLGRGESAIVAVPEVREGSRVLSRLETAFSKEAAVVHSAASPAERSPALWAAASGEAGVVLGGRGSVLAMVPRLALLIVHLEHDPSFKEMRAPYYDAREAALARVTSSGGSLLLVSPTPSLTTTARLDSGWEVHEPLRQAERADWPSVEVLEPPRSGMPRRAIAAILETYRRSGRSLVLLPRARSTAAGPGPERVAGFVKRVLPDARVERGDREGLAGRDLEEVLTADVIVATEAVLAEVERPPIETAVALGVDSWVGRPTGRAVEEAFQILWTLATTLVQPGRRGRLLLETSDPSHRVVQAIIRGSYRFFAERELAERQRSESPPYRHLIRLSASSFGRDLLAGLEDLDQVELLGPAPVSSGEEILLKTADLQPLLDPLRRMVSDARQAVSVEVDPRDW